MNIHKAMRIFNRAGGPTLPPHGAWRMHGFLIVWTSHQADIYIGQYGYADNTNRLASRHY